MNQRASQKINPVLLAQIENGVAVKDYLDEGCWIMEDISKMIETFKKGGYNNFVDALGSASINNNS